MPRYTEDTLVQQTSADYLRDALGWEVVTAYNDETFGPEGMLGRRSDRDVVLTRKLGEKLIEFNPGLPEDAYRDALRQIVDWSETQSALSLNQEKYALLKDGVPVSFRDAKGELVKQWLRVFDFGEPERNHFLAVRELWVRGGLYRRRADIVGFVNGIPLLFVELKNLDDEAARAVREGLDEESLALFDLLRKPGLERKDIERIKKVAAQLLETLKAEKLRVENWREKESTRDAVHVVIEDFLWADQTGLPSPAYSEEDVKSKGEDVFRHVYRVYPSIPSPYYAVH